MAFKLNQTGTFSWPVKVSVPKDGGGFETGTFDAVFKRLTRTEAEKMGNDVMNGDTTGIDAVRSILVGWTGVMDGDEKVPFSEENAEKLLEIPGVAVSLFKAFTDANNGVAQAKN